jgi:hypothetical protein
MALNKIHKFEQKVVLALNGLYDWELTWAENKQDFYDAYGKTWKGIPCFVEMKFRNTYYEYKMLEKSKYDKLMAHDPEAAKIYLVSDPKGTYWFYLNKLKMPEPVEMRLPDSTLWTKKRKPKLVYLLKEEMASMVTLE